MLPSFSSFLLKFASMDVQVELLIQKFMKLLQVCENHVHYPVKLSFPTEDQAPQPEHLKEEKSGCKCCFTLYNGKKIVR